MFVLSRCHRLLNAPSSSTTHTHTAWGNYGKGYSMRDGVGFLQTWHVRVLVNRGPGWEWFESKHRQVSAYSQAPSAGPPGTEAIFTYTQTLRRAVRCKHAHIHKHTRFPELHLPSSGARSKQTVCFLVHNKVNCQVIMTFNCLGFILKLKRVLIECKIVLPVCWSVIAQKTQWSCLPYLRCFC